MPTPTDDRHDLLTAIAYVEAEAGEQELRTALEALVEPAGEEKGYVDDDPRRSSWGSKAGLDAHLATPHLVHVVGVTGDLLERIA